MQEGGGFSNIGGLGLCRWCADAADAVSGWAGGMTLRGALGGAVVAVCRLVGQSWWSVGWLGKFWDFDLSAGGGLLLPRISGSRVS